MEDARCSAKLLTTCEAAVVSHLMRNHVLLVCSQNRKRPTEHEEPKAEAQQRMAGHMLDYKLCTAFSKCLLRVLSEGKHIHTQLPLTGSTAALRGRKIEKWLLPVTHFTKRQKFRDEARSYSVTCLAIFSQQASLTTSLSASMLCQYQIHHEEQAHPLCTFLKFGPDSRLSLRT